MKHLVVFVALAFVGCAHGGEYVWVDELPDSEAAPEPYRLQAGDLLDVTVWSHANLSGEVRVRSDGNATLPLIGDLAASGLTPRDWADEVQRLLGPVVVDPKVTVTVKDVQTPTVAVLGEVLRVGEYPLNRGDGVLQMVARAGGMTEFASADHIYVVRRQPAPVRIRFTYRQLTSSAGRAVGFMLKPGDAVVVE